MKNNVNLFIKMANIYQKCKNVKSCMLKTPFKIEKYKYNGTNNYNNYNKIKF